MRLVAPRDIVGSEPSGNRSALRFGQKWRKMLKTQTQTLSASILDSTKGQNSGKCIGEIATPMGQGLQLACQSHLRLAQKWWRYQRCQSDALIPRETKASPDRVPNPVYAG